MLAILSIMSDRNTERTTTRFLCFVVAKLPSQMLVALVSFSCVGPSRFYDRFSAGFPVCRCLEGGLDVDSRVMGLVDTEDEELIKVAYDIKEGKGPDESLFYLYRCSSEKEYCIEHKYI
ncbi:unnamed protein product [Cylindrotheca closterium]|uniref:Uncharacterized protein n=1 Tax=Cylindrotheca closterium TaxID=2856 RepID=A0AAD2FJU8_9STRA|nr:unnamed protein product [Cylindrotheca closterium]